jgi:heptosyltransferase-2
LRRWPIENYVVLAKALVGRGFEVVLTGGPDDRWASAHFFSVAELAPGGRFADLIGTLSLVETLALLDSAAVTVTHDTGPLHMAGITSTGIVAIFGPTDPHGRLPQRPNCVALWGGEGFACRPCYDGRDYAPCRHNGCMAQVTPEMVVEQIELLVRARVEAVARMPRVLTPSHTGLVRLEPAGKDQ